MDRTIKAIEHSSPTKDGKPKVKPAKTLHEIDIACIGAEAFTRHLKTPNAETFITSLYEIDRAIDEKQAPEITDDAEMQALILPERYRSFRATCSRRMLQMNYPPIDHTI
jgi:hypothetical protein